MSNNKWDVVKDNEQLSVTVNGNIRANDMEILCRAALHHKGIVRLPCDLANVFIASGTLVRVLPEFHSPSSALWAVYLSRSYQTPLVRQFIDFIAQSWKNDLIA